MSTDGKRGAKYERQLKDTPPMRGVVVGKLSNSLPLARSSAKVAVNCETCGIPFEKYACWAKRTAHHFCGRACASAFKKRPVECKCVICGAIYVTTPVGAKRIKVCSRECLRERRRRLSMMWAQNPLTDWLHRYGNPHKGVETNLAKLTDDAVRKIRADQRSQSTIAKDYGVTQTLIQKVKAGLIWKHVK